MESFPQPSALSEGLLAAGLLIGKHHLRMRLSCGCDGFALSLVELRKDQSVLGQQKLEPRRRFAYPVCPASASTDASTLRVRQVESRFWRKAVGAG
jgi:hypothetical protein